MTESQKREVLEVERRFWDAMKTKDAASAQRMTDDGCIIVGAQGASAIDAKTMGKMTNEGAWVLKQFTIDDQNAHVKFVGDDVAIVAYKVNESVVVDGKTMPLEANDASVWVKRNGDWVCALHTESLAGDPFGRDRNTVDKAH
ncbi:MAG: nuclear transport factor 2 family protein [Gemmatimonadaceae bacterium]